jgi:hypothetical protein
MSLIHLRRMWNHCRNCHQFIKHTKSFCSVKTLLIKDFSALQTRMCPSQHFSAACLKRNLFYLQQTPTNNSLNCILQTHFSTCCVQYKSVVPDEIVSSTISDIDLEKLQEQVIKERKETQQDGMHLTHIVKEIIIKRCDEILANLGPEDERLLKVIKLEHNFMLSEGYQIPDEAEMTSQNWIEAMKLKSKFQRLKYYMYLSKLSFRKEANRLKRAAPKEEKERGTAYEHGRLFMRIYETTMKRWQNHRLAASALFGIPLVIDMDYSSIMRPQEIRNTASQLQKIYVANRADEEMPFHLHFTSCSHDNSIYKLFQLLLQESQNHLATVTEKSYLDLFDKQSLVYLSPNGRQVLKKFDPNAVYIIGAFNDKATHQPISYARAKEQNIKCMRLPLDEYMKWGSGSKSLTLDQVIQIMLAVKNKKSWPEAFTAIPKRKLYREDSDS